jgi:hypothetical protein
LGKKRTNFVRFFKNDSKFSLLPLRELAISDLTPIVGQPLKEASGSYVIFFFYQLSVAKLTNFGEMYAIWVWKAKKDAKVKNLTLHVIKH